MNSGFCSDRCRLRVYYQENKARLRARARERYATDPEYRAGLKRSQQKYAQTEKGRASDKAKKARFAERHPGYETQRAALNSAANTERARQWAKDNPERAAEHWRRHSRARRKGLASDKATIRDIRDWHDVIALDVCSYCGAPCEQFDHIEPISKGGAHAWDNLTSACQSCNASKSNTALLLFLVRKNGDS